MNRAVKADVQDFQNVAWQTVVRLWHACDILFLAGSAMRVQDRSQSTTANVMYCQRKAVQQVLEQDGYYVIAVKAN